MCFDKAAKLPIIRHGFERAGWGMWGVCVFVVVVDGLAATLIMIKWIFALLHLTLFPALSFSFEFCIRYYDLLSQLPLITTCQITGQTSTAVSTSTQGPHLLLILYQLAVQYLSYLSIIA